MKLPRTEDAALLLVSDLASLYPTGRVSLTAIADRHGVSFLFLKKIARRLKSAGIVKSHEGYKGGYELSKAPDVITVWDIFHAVGSSDKSQNVKNTGACPLNDRCLPQTIQRVFDAALRDSLSGISVQKIKELNEKTHRS